MASRDLVNEDDELVIDCTAELLQRQQQLEEEALQVKAAQEAAEALRLQKVAAAQVVLDSNPGLATVLEAFGLVLPTQP